MSSRFDSGLCRGVKPVTDWATIRAWVLDRDGYMCQICKVATATDADHIWPRRLGGTDHVDNLQAACGSCNKSKGARVDISSAETTQLIQALEALDARSAALEEEISAFAVEAAVRIGACVENSPGVLNDGDLVNLISLMGSCRAGAAVRAAMIGSQLKVWGKVIDTAKRRADEHFNRVRSEAAELLTYMPTADTTVGEAVDARRAYLEENGEAA